MKLERWMLVLLLFAMAIQSIYYYPQLPQTLASQFDGRGQPSGWMSKDAFFRLHAGLLVLMTMVFFIAPPLLFHLRVPWINLPNKGYWLAVGRRAETISFLEKQLRWFGCATLLFGFCIVQFVIHTNLAEGRAFSHNAFWFILGPYMAFTAVWTVRLVFRFRRTR